MVLVEMACKDIHMPAATPAEALGQHVCQVEPVVKHEYAGGCLHHKSTVKYIGEPNHRFLLIL